MKLIILYIILISSYVFTQTVYEPIYNDHIYSYIQRLSLKNIVNYHDEIKPIPRSTIGNYLIIANKKRESLTILEKRELDFLLCDYAVELKNLEDSLTIFSFDNNDRFRLLGYRNESFQMSADPILGASLNNSNELRYHTWNGVRIWGYLTNYLGFSFDFRDNHETYKNTKIDRRLPFSRIQGRKLMQGDADSQDFSEVHSTITGSWDWGSFSIGKDNLVIGSAYDDKIILSAKTPSFPFIRMTLTPVHWISFNYIHAWLNSGLIDSSTIRNSSVTVPIFNKTYDRRQKYLASHFITLYPVKELAFTIGESIVYSDQIEYTYLIPIMFFRLADHYLSTGDTGDNAQLYFNAIYRIPSVASKVYATLFVDEFNADFFNDESKGAITVGYTFGLQKNDPIIKNSEIIFEYTRINPFAYMNFNPAQTYASNGYQLGHWIGSNADQIFVKYNQGISRGLYLSLFGEYIRKGQKESPDAQYTLPYPDFLFGEKNYYRNYGCELKYQITHNLFAQTTFSYSNWSGKAASEYLDNRRGVYSFSLYYGL